MLNSPCKKQGEFFMKDEKEKEKEQKKQEKVSFIKGFAVTYILLDMIGGIFKAFGSKPKKIKNKKGKR